MITIIDYGVGNLHSISKAIENLGQKVVVTNDPEKVLISDGLILPGVGAFVPAMQSLKNNNLIEPINEFVSTGKPVLGICLGLQLFFTDSEEGGTINGSPLANLATGGLNIIKGKVKKINAKVEHHRDLRNPDEQILRSRIKLPQIGWNTIKKTGTYDICKNIPDNTFFYFVHSYHVIPEDKDIIVAKTHYGMDIVSIIQKNNISGTQFHPEKSSIKGIQFLKNWIKILC